ncbi:hypothetical protein DOM22_10970 [Bdellovibrio sp. ZAP7]|uniref:RHS repeat domain-containing protein n=1 Tax=Bdellovibrio sp. ZAP7 TaxID=2231053 RepID=UPI00115B3EE7|nr:RHS repeat-associated core domain-containing protein [Bdellovibrio sp. ZAP7]QDK45633.1 hypothetical protein DOM22_10970 [Bdellovibrio sp. ZAP7]
MSSMVAMALFMFSVVFSISSSAQEKTCEAQLVEDLNTAITGCTAWNSTCEPGVYVAQGIPILSNSEMFISVRCDWILCGSGDHHEVISQQNIQKCPSQIGIDPKTLVEDLYQGTNQCGSIIKAENQILGESVPVVGASFAMNYFTSWVEGRTATSRMKASFELALTNAYTYSVPITYDMNVYLADRPAPVMSAVNITTPDVGYSWDGLDANGNPILGSVGAKTVVTAQTLSGPIEMTNEMFLGSLKAIHLGLGGWLPDNFYYYDPNSKHLYSGDGEKQKVTVYPWINGGFYYPIDSVSRILYFDSTGRIVQIKSGLLGAVLQSFAYDSLGRLNSITETFGRTTYFNRDGAGNFISITAPNGTVTSVSTDTNGYLSSITNPMNQTHSFTYYGTKGLLQTFTKPGGQVSTFSYDAWGNLTTDSHSGGYFWTLAQNITLPDRINSVLQTPMGRTTNYIGSNDGNSSMSREVLPSGATNTYQRDQNNFDRKTLEVTWSEGTNADPRFPTSRYTSGITYRDQVRTSVVSGVIRQAQLQDLQDPFSILSYSLDYYAAPSFTATEQYNPTLKTFTTTTGVGKTSVLAIDSYERVVSETTGNLTPIQYGYTNEKLTSVTQGARVSTFGYNSTTGYLESVTNPLSQSTLFSYNNAGELIGQIGPDLRLITYNYDANGNLTGVTPFGRPIHQFSANSSELPSGYQPPVLTGVPNVNTSYSYNLDKQLTQILKPNGQSITYNYDATTGLLTDYVTSIGTYLVQMNTQSERPQEITTPNNFKNRFDWANEDIVYNQYRNASDVQIYSYRKNYQYDGVLLNDVVENPSGTQSSISYTFNSDQDLTNAGDMILNYNTPNGQLTTVKMGTSSTTGFTDTYTYNTFGEVTGYTVKRGSTTIYTMNLTRDALGRIDTKTQTMNSITDAYSYVFDLSGRLQQVTKNASVVANYGYDSNSNRNSGNVGAQTTTATYDDQDRLTAYNSITFTYNANGDLLTKTNTVTNTTTQYTYDVFGNLTQVVLPGGATTISYEIDGLNRRVGMKVNNVLQKRWVYMDQYRIAAELNSAGTITKRFVYGSKGNIPDYMIASGVKYRIISDQLGSPRLVVKQSDGTITQRMNHDEFGRVIEDTNPGFTPFGFAGGLYDNQTGLVRFGARDYDPEIGRWTAKDPIDFDGEMENLYGYSFFDPVNYFDQSGESAIVAVRVVIVGGVIYLIDNRDRLVEGVKDQAWRSKIINLHEEKKEFDNVKAKLNVLRGKKNESVPKKKNLYKPFRWEPPRGKIC